MRLGWLLFRLLERVRYYILMGIGNLFKKQVSLRKNTYL